MINMSYVSKAKVNSIKATSRASVKIKDSYYTVEYTEERIIPDVEGVDLEAELKLLWDEANYQCDDQIEQIIKQFK